MPSAPPTRTAAAADSSKSTAHAAHGARGARGARLGTRRAGGGWRAAI
eukprot:COSAG01_NODE_9592_length_2399_cov_1.226522_4_plen_47_part_01